MAPMPDLTPEEERILVRDITVAAEAQSKEGDTFLPYHEQVRLVMIVAFEWSSKVVLMMEVNFVIVKDECTGARALPYFLGHYNPLLDNNILEV
ncbi:hypothetical protein HPP92_023188 [Vanilla planifolia]|uniref:Uncharacterized protein n=1 Tax=Vanilla planifolia TaxID=51239 RepID=A0A835PPW3_VANPL|nr:hypothetical protein HPP92_023188 [Vanilla planifolia]